mgnify:FL=1
MVDDFSQDTSGTYSNSNSMGIDSGSYDPSQSSVSDNNVNTNANIAAAIRNQNIGGGGDTYDARQALQTARGITATNPFGYNNPFQGIADLFGVDVNYNNIMSQGDMNDIANKNYNRYVNPMNDPNKPGFDPNKLASETQRDLNKGFGSLFGSSLGEQTQLGQIKEQKPDALSGMDTGALTAFSLLGGGLPSLMANQMANPSNYIPANAPQYQASRDPMSKQYDAETYDKGYMASTIDALYGTGATKQATTLVDDAVNYLTNAGKP